jgi:hypothetical protein
MKQHTYSASGVNRTVNIDQFVKQLQDVYELGDDTEMAVNTRVGGEYRRMDGFFMGAVDAFGMPSTEVFSFQDKGDGEFYTVKFTEIVRTY